MLVLSRKEGESIVIGPDIEVRVVQIRGDRVRLGFDAPPRIEILRTELAHRALSASSESDHADKD